MVKSYSLARRLPIGKKCSGFCILLAAFGRYCTLQTISLLLIYAMGMTLLPSQSERVRTLIIKGFSGGSRSIVKLYCTVF